MEHYFKVSDVKEARKKLVLDFLICGRIATQNRMNYFSKQPDISYLAPYEVYTVMGRRPDRKDADGMGWERQITIRQLFQSIGDEVDLNDIENILNLANTCTGSNYNCIDGFQNYFSIGTRELWGADGKGCNSCSWNTFQEMRIGFGYIEIKSQNADVYELIDKYGEMYRQKITHDTYSEQELKTKKNRIQIL